MKWSIAKEKEKNRTGEAAHLLNRRREMIKCNSLASNGLLKFCVIVREIPHMHLITFHQSLMIIMNIKLITRRQK